ncbi:MAG: hypothetical protein ABI723_22360 [Bacteroidia bacterium]
MDPFKRFGNTDKQTAIKNLSHVAQMLEENFMPEASLDKLINHERNESYKYEGITVFGKSYKTKAYSTHSVLRKS